MKKDTFILAFAVLFVFSNTGFVSADPQGWMSDTRVTFAPENSWYPSLAADQQGNVHIAWNDERNGNSEIYYKKLNNNGVNLTSDIRLTFNSAYSGEPSLAIDFQGNVHISWHDDRDGNDEIYYKKLNNNGTALTPDIRLTFNSAYSGEPSLAIDFQGNVHIAWNEERNGNRDIYYKKLNNNGTALTPGIRLTFQSETSEFPSLSIDPNGNVYIAWQDNRDYYPNPPPGCSFALCFEVYYKKLNNNGTALTPDIRFTFSSSAPAFSEAPSISTDQNGNIHIAWEDYRDQNMEIYYKKLNNNGVNLTSDIRLSFDPAVSWYPSLATDPQGNVHIAWNDERNGNSEIYYKKLNNNGTALTQDIRLTFQSAISEFPSLSTDLNGNVHVAWQDYRDGNYEIYYKRSLPTSPPVLLVHGIYSDDRIWDNVERNLTREGWSVYRLGQVLNRPGFDPNNGPIRLLSYQLRDAIQRVKQQTGAPKVTVIAHSMGGLVTRYYIKSDLYRDDIDKLITLGTPNEGAPIAGNRAADLFGLLLGIFGNNTSIFGTAREEMTPNSEFLNELNSNYETRGIEHTEVAGTEPNYLLILLANQTSYLPFGRDAPTDSIVPRWSVNIPNIRCYQSNVTHTSTLGTAYYDDQATIDAVANILRGGQVRLEQCPSEGEDDSEPSNAVQIITLSRSINRGELQTAVSGRDLGKTFGVLLNWDDAEMLHLELSSPSGAMINASNYRAFSNVSFSGGAFFNKSFEWFVFNAPEIGNWTINVSGLGILSAKNYTLTVFMEKSFAIELSTNKTNYQPQEIVVINARLTNDTLPVLYANVSATITKPDSTSSQIMLFDDGNHYDGDSDDGIYGNGFIEAQLEGLYTIEADATKLDLFHLQDRIAFFVELFSDIYINNTAINFEPVMLIPGRNMTTSVSAVIQNIGNRDTANVTVEFYDGHPTTGGLLFGNVTKDIPINSSIIVSSLFSSVFMPNASLGLEGVPQLNEIVNLSFVDTGLRAHDIHVIISPFSGYPESNYSNNIASKMLNFSEVTYITAFSLGTTPGIPLGDGRVIPLNFDPLLLLSLQAPMSFGLENSIGILENGVAIARFNVPNVPELRGLTVYAAFVTIYPQGAQPFVSISNAVPLRFA